MAFITTCIRSFVDGWRSVSADDSTHHDDNKRNKLIKAPARQAKADRTMRDQLSEKQVDNMVQDSFPASDSPTTY